MSLKSSIFLFTILLCLGVKAQQSASYSQYIFNTLYVNPAYAGYKERINTNAIYRNQWTAVDGAPESMSLSVDGTAMYNDVVGWGLQVSTDNLGAQKSFSAFANYAYRLPLNDDNTTRLALGFGAGILQSSLNGDQLIGNDVGDNRIPAGIVSKIVPDVRLGAFFSTSKFYAGLSAENLVSQALSSKTNSDYYFPTPSPHFYLTAGAIFNLVDEDIQLKPSLLFKQDFKAPGVLDVNAFFLFKQKLWLGGGYRANLDVPTHSYLQKGLSKANAVVAMAEFYFNDRVRLGYAYDHTIGNFSGYPGSTHEISLSFSFYTSEEKKLLFCYF